MHQSKSSSGDDLYLRTLWRAVRRNRWLVLAIPAVILASTAAFLVTADRVYQTSTAIRIDEQKSKIGLLDALETLSSGGSAVETEMEVLRSRALAADIVDSLGLRMRLEAPRRTLRSRVAGEVHVEPDAWPSTLRLRRTEGGFEATAEYVPAEERGRFFLFRRTVEEPLGTVAPGERVAFRGASFVVPETAAQEDEIVLEVLDHDDAVRALRRQLGVSRPNREADIVLVDVRGTDPEIVNAVAAAMARLFIDRRQDVQSSEARGTVRFLNEQIDTLAVQLRSAEEALRAFRKENRVVSLEAEADAQVTRVAEMQAQRDVMAAERTALAGLIAEVDAEARVRDPAQPSPYRRLLSFPTLLRNPAASELLRALIDLENERTELLGRRTLRDPDVVVVSNRIGEIEDQLRSIASTYAQGLTNNVGSLDATLGSILGELETIPDREIRFARLKRQAQLLGELHTLLQTRLKEAEIAAAIEDVSVRVVDPPVLPRRPIRPRVPLSLTLALVLGLALGVGAAIAREQLDTTVRTREDLQQLTGLTVLGLIPRIGAAAAPPRGPRGWRERRRRERQREEPAPIVTREDPRSPVAEAYRSLRTNIAFSSMDEPPSTLVFTSAMPGEGKSTTSTNLAVTLAQQEQRVILIDADLRRGRLHEALGVRWSAGLADVLVRGVAVEEAVVGVELEGGGRLDLLGTGTMPPNPAELLGSERMRELLERLAGEYDVVLIDTPPLNVVTDAALLGPAVDGVVLVARAAVTDRGALGFALEQIRNVRAPLLGVVLNDVDFVRESYYGAYDSAASYYEAAGGRS